MGKRLDNITIAWHKSAVRQNLAAIRAAYQQAKASLEGTGKLLERQTQEAGTPKVKATKRALCTQILTECGPLDVYQLLKEMEIRGYSTTGKNPVGSLRSFLYQAGGFVCTNGVFGLPNQTIPGGRRLTRREVCSAILTEKGPLEIDEILVEMRRRGYHLTGANPKHSIRTFLYHNDHLFSWHKKRFSVKQETKEETKPSPPDEAMSNPPQS